MTELLPQFIASLFWECAPGTVSWEVHREAIIERVLSRGTWDSIRWLRAAAGEEAIREMLLRTRGRSLNPRQLRLWELLLDLPRELVDKWLRAPERQIWDRRNG